MHGNMAWLRSQAVETQTCPLQVIANISIVIMDEVSPARRSWLTWRDTMHLLDIVCCCAVLFPIVWRIKHLRDAAQTDGKAARCVLPLPRAYVLS